jgi:hypothetical protein
LKQSSRYRRLGDAAILFDENTWKTHVFTPAASIIYEALLEHFGTAPIPLRETSDFLAHDLDLDPSSDDIKEMLSMLRQLGVVTE